VSFKTPLIDLFPAGFCPTLSRPLCTTALPLHAYALGQWALYRDSLQFDNRVAYKNWHVLVLWHSSGMFWDFRL